MNRRWRNCWLVAVGFGCALSAQADPIPINPSASRWTDFRHFGSDWTLEIPFIVVPILLEAMLVLFILRRMRRPRFFLLWILGMHLLTYPLFIGIAIGVQRWFPGLMGIAVGEALITAIEGCVIYLICGYLPARIDGLPVVSPGLALEASVAGNLLSFTISFVIAIVYRMMGN